MRVLTRPPFVWLLDLGLLGMATGWSAAVVLLAVAARHSERCAQVLAWLSCSLQP